MFYLLNGILSTFWVLQHIIWVNTTSVGRKCACNRYISSKRLFVYCLSFSLFVARQLLIVTCIAIFLQYERKNITIQATCTVHVFQPFQRLYFNLKESIHVPSIFMHNILYTQCLSLISYMYNQPLIVWSISQNDMVSITNVL